MGIIPDPVTPGANCAICFDPGETPSMVKVFFSGIQPGAHWIPAWGPAPNGYFDLIQNPASPCFYNDTIVGWPSIGFRMFADQSQLFYKPGPFINCFTKTVNAKCVFEFENFFQGAPNNDYFGGWGHVAVPTQLLEVAERLTSVNDSNPRFENFPVSASQTVVRYAGKDDGTNISIKVDTPLS